MDVNYEPVYLEAVSESIDMTSGKFPPQRIRVEPTDSVNILVRSEDRSYGNDFDFQIDLITTSVHIRKIQLAKIMLPLLPQINTHNRSVTVTHIDGDVTFNLDEGFYSVQSLVNMMQNNFLAAWVSLDITNLVTVSYNIERRSITITDDNGEAFYIHNNSPFALYARNVMSFVTQPPLTPASKTSFESVSLGMIYSRYVVLGSSRLTEDQKSFSIVSNRGPSDIVSIIDISSHYTASQFTVSSSFPGTDVVIDTLDYSPRINVLNRTKALKVLDLYLNDEFGFKLSTIDTSSYTFQYPVAMWFQAYL